MKFTLIHLDEATPVGGFQAEEFPSIVGRSDDVDWVLDDRWVSRRHCRIDWDGAELSVTDLGSKHGTYVNGERASFAVLKAGDRLAIGLCTFVVSLSESDEDEVPTAESSAVPV